MKSEMQLAWEELVASPEFIKQQQAWEEQLRHQEELNKIPVFLKPEVHKVARRGDEEFYALKLSAADVEGWMQNILRVAQEHMRRFTMDEQTYKVEICSDLNFADLAEWIDTQIVGYWSVQYRITRETRNGPYIFSFSDMKSASLFKLCFG